MKFLKNRDNYLKTVNERRELQIDQKLEHLQYQLLVENMAGSGVMGNEIKWGDCLLGRLINSIIRKSQIGANLVRMKPVISRLRSALDDLLIGHNFLEFEPRDKAIFNLALVSEYLDVLTIAVQNFGTPNAATEFDEFDEIKGLVKDTISKLEGTTSTPYLGSGFENKNEILRQLKKLEKHLDTLKEPQASTQQNQQQQGGGTASNNQNQTVNNSNLQNQANNNANAVYIQNFNHVINIFFMTKSLNVQQAVAHQNKTASATSSVPVGVTSSVPTGGNTGAGRFADSFHYNTSNTFKVFEDSKGNVNIFRLLKQLTDSFSKSGADAAKDALNSIKSNKKSNPQIKAIYDTIRKKEGLSVTVNEDVNQVLNNTEGIASSIFNLYQFLKPKGGNIDDPKLNSDFKKELVSFVTTMKPCLSVDLYDVDVNEIESEDEEKEEKNESLLFRYQSFIRKMNEAGNQPVTGMSGQNYFNPASGGGNQGGGNQGGGNQGGGNQGGGNQGGGNQGGGNQGGGNQGGGNQGNVVAGAAGNQQQPQTLKQFADDIRDWWNKNMDLQNYIYSKDDAQKAKDALDKKLAAQKDSIVISGIDPVLEILKCFNRAYKIHTTQVIPSGRTGGKVSNKVFMEYTCFGSGSPENAGAGGGPYRNNKLFDMWESNVMDMLGEKKYQPIFNVKTRLKVGEEYIEKAGSNLRKFMTDMLNGDDMYGKGGDSKGGLQAKFLDKYFGYKDGDDAKNTHFEGESERQVNQSNTPDPILAIKEDGSQPVEGNTQDPNDLVGTAFALELDSGDLFGKTLSSGDTFYFFIHHYEKSNGDFYVSFCQTAYYLKQYLQAGNTSRTCKLDTADFKQVDEIKSGGGSAYKIVATRIKADSIYGTDGQFKLGKRLQLSYVVPQDVKNKSGDILPATNEMKNTFTEKGGIFELRKFYHIVDENTKERVKASNISRVEGWIDSNKRGYRKLGRTNMYQEDTVRMQ